MSALGKLVVSLALNHAEYTQGLDRSSQEALKFAQNSQKSFDQASNSAKEFLGNVAGNVAGAIASVVGLNAAFNSVRDSINILDSLDEAAEKTGSTIEDLSRIQKVAKNFGDAFEPIDQAIVKLSKGLAGIDDPSNDAIRALDAINVSALNADGTLRKSADVYIDVARSLQGYADGNEKAAVATALFGKSGAELLPELNNLANGIDSVSAATEHDAKQAALFNDRLALAKSSVNNLFVGLAVDLLPTLNNIAVAFNNSTGSMKLWSVVSESVSFILKGAAITGRAVIFVLEELGISLGARAAQLAALSQMDFSGAKFIGAEMRKDIEQNRIEYKEFVSTVLNGEQHIAQAMESGGSKEIIKFQLNAPAAIDATTRSLEKQAKAFDIELYKLKQYESDAKRARDITGSVATKQEKYNETLDELNRLRPDLSVETYNRALEKAQKELDGTAEVAKTTFNDIDQYAVQASRNIQTSLANFLFDPFDDGLKGMVTGAANAVRRMLAEFGALKIAQSVGLTSLFSGASGAANASTGSGGMLSDVANLGSSAFNLFKFGGGISQGVAGLFGSTGTQAAAEAGASALWGASGAASGGISGMLGGLAPAAGPLMAAFAIDQIGRMFAGDKKLGGAEMIPVIGGFLAGMFGHGPMKFRQQSLQGDVSSSGFDGDLTNVFRAKGGLFVGNKHKSVTEQLSPEMQSAFDTAISGFYGSAHKFAENLGLDVNLVDSFSQQIQIKSEKNQKLTEEAITKMLNGIGDSLAKNVMPEIEQLKKADETLFQAFSRVNNEFVSLADGATILGKSVAEAKDYIKGVSFESRTAFVDAAGGIDALNQKVAFFAQNFLSNAEKIAPSAEKLNAELDKLGLSTDLTKDQYKDLVQSYGKVNGVTEETLQALLTLAPAFLSVRDAAKAANDAAVNEAFSAVQRSVDAKKKALTDEYNDSLKTANDRIADVNASIAKLGSLSNALRSATESLSPLGLMGARAQLQNAILGARNGNFPETESIQRALSVLSNQSTDAFSTRLDFLRSQAESAGMVDELSQLTGSQLTLEQRSLDALEANRDRLTEGFNTQISQLDAILSDAQQQIDLLNGINNSIASLPEALGGLNRSIIASGGTNLITSPAVGGNTDISAGDINAFVKTHTPDQIYVATQQYGVTEDQLVASGAVTSDQINSYLQSKNLPHFASGTSYVPRTGPAIVHQGERIINPQQNQDIVSALQQLINKIGEGTSESEQLRRMLRNAMEETDNGLAIRNVLAA